jgi:protein O-GlcNAc transferase
LLSDARRALARGRVTTAMDLVEQALARKLEPRHGEALFDLGNLFAGRDQPTAAIAVFERALELFPGHPALLVNLGMQLDRAGAADRAERCYREVLEARPGEVAALANLAHLLFTQARFADALAVYDRLVVAAPEAPAEIWNNRGVCQTHSRAADAEPSFRHALMLAPDSPQILANLGFLLCDGRRFDEARPLLQKAHALDRSRLQVAAQLLHVDLQFADWGEFERKRSEVIAGVAQLASRAGQTVPPFAFLSICDDPGLQLAAARSFAWPPASDEGRRHIDDANDGGPLRIGFVATAFHDHPVPRLVVDLLERLDRGRFKVFAYALGTAVVDSLHARITSAVAAFTELGRMTSADAVKRVREDRIAILFDLAGHTDHARPDIFAARAAPVQINFLGYAGTLGAEYYDYILTDATATPISEQRDFSEKLACVDDCYIPSDSRRVIAEAPKSRAEYGLPPGAFVFCTQAAPYKVVPEMFDTWMRLLADVDDSVLWLRPMHAVAEANLRAAARQRGIAAERLAFAPQEPLPRYLARFRLADLYLDTYPFGSHTTVNDALFAGLPVLTLSGRSMAARASASQLRAVGLQELIAASHDEYVSTGLTLARNQARLVELTTHLRRQGHASALFDMDAYARKFEAELARIWDAHTAARR